MGYKGRKYGFIKGETMISQKGGITLYVKY